jgi:hypothetical protein
LNSQLKYLQIQVSHNPSCRHQENWKCYRWKELTGRHWSYKQVEPYLEFVKIKW